MISHLSHVKGVMTSRPIKIYKGDYHSVPSNLFSCSTKPTPPPLNKRGYGYNTPHGNISRIIYMDALKTNVKDDNQETGLL